VRLLECLSTVERLSFVGRGGEGKVRSQPAGTPADMILRHDTDGLYEIF
jgi:hypothetical protein